MEDSEFFIYCDIIIGNSMKITRWIDRLRMRRACLLRKTDVSEVFFFSIKKKAIFERRLNLYDVIYTDVAMYSKNDVETFRR